MARITRTLDSADDREVRRHVGKLWQFSQGIFQDLGDDCFHKVSPAGAGSYRRAPTGGLQQDA